MAEGQKYVDNTGQTRDLTTGAVLEDVPVQSQATPVFNSTQLTQPARPVGILSTERAAETVAKKEQSLNKLATMGGTPTPSTPTPPAKPSESSSRVTLINPETEQEYTYYDPEINKENIQKLLSQGYVVSNATGTTPGVTTPRNPEVVKMESEAAKANADLDRVMTQLADFKITDAELAGTIDALTKKYAIRKQQYEDINKRRVGQLETTGLRLGSQYTGGKGGVFGGIVAEEERQGVARLADLDAELQASVLAAKEAQRTNNWKVFAQEVTLAEAKRAEKTAVLKELNKLAVEQDKKIQESGRQATRDSAIADLLSQGVSNPAAILQLLNYDDQGKIVGDFTAKEVSDALKSLKMDDGTLSQLSGAARDMQSLVEVGLIDPSLPPQTRWEQYLKYTQSDKVLSPTEAAKLGVAYGTTERQAYGKMPVKEATGDLPAKTIAQIDTLRNQFSNSPIVKQFNDTQNRLLSFSSILDGSVSGPGDLAVVFEFMKGLDPSSVVREQEYENAAKSGNIFAGVFSKFNGYLKPNGGFLPPSVKKEFLNIVQQKYNVVEKQYDNFYNETGRLIDKKTGEGDGVDYLPNYKQVSLKNIDAKEKPTYIVNTGKGAIDLGAFEQK